MTIIANRAFDNCHTLSSITVDSENKAYASADGVLYDKDITELITCPESKTSVEIPGSVTIIANSAFDNCHTLSSITVDSENRAYASVDGVLYNKDITESIICPKGKTSVRIPDTMAKIRRLAFSDCDSLTSVEIPESVSVIGDNAFRGCNNLTSITVDSENKAYASVDGVLYNKDITVLIKCPEGKTSVEIPESVTTIEDNAFSGCRNLTSVKIPKSVTDIGFSAFGFCDGLTSIKILESVTEIGYGAFEYCLGLTSVDIPESVTVIGDCAFHNCRNLTSVKIPESVTVIGNSAFSYCNNLTSVDIPESVTVIGDCAFAGCSNLTSVKIPESVTEIGYAAFGSCLGLTSVEIPESVTTFRNNAFDNCSRLMSITVDSGNKVYSSVDGVLYNKDNTKLIKCPNGLTSVKIPGSVTTIEENAFAYCSNLISVKIPGSVTEIGNSAFSDCSNLTSVEIPESVTTIGYGAFDNCLSLSSITVDNANKAYVSVDGVLYNKDMTKLIADPTYKMQSGTTESESDF